MIVGADLRTLPTSNNLEVFSLLEEKVCLGFGHSKGDEDDEPAGEEMLVKDDCSVPTMIEKRKRHIRVDVAIIEVGLGGTRDSTNVPLVPAFTVPQLSEAMDVLQEKARDLLVPLEVVAPLDRRDLKGKELSLSGDHQLTNAGLAVALCKSWLQRTGNWEKLFQHAGLEDNLPEAFLRGLSTARLSGRAQIVYDSSLESSDLGGSIRNTSGDLVFYLDGAHSPESMEACATWFSSAVKEDRKQSSVPSLSSKLQTLEEVWSNGHVQLRKNESAKISKKQGHFWFLAIPADIRFKDLTWQFNLQRVWEKIIHGKDAVCKSSEMQKPENTPPRSFIHEDVSICSPADGRYACSAVVSSLPMTINWLRDYAKENPASRIQWKDLIIGIADWWWISEILNLQVLVTGSLHLVGDVLKLLRR
ncbi:hypothetical protein DH2020_041513 [Rehmannia glutinosa]|uniref:Folylpolyglutamate synthase n=1 Tax=Rehmannia glutinosa TaxID=99300 RepID=A0ABR0UQZ3_REHGL